MKTVYEVLSSAIKRGFYRNKGCPEEYIQFNDFGSQCCPITIFDEKMNKIREGMMHTDSLNRYELILEKNLPKAFRNKKSKLVRMTSH